MLDHGQVEDAMGLLDSCGQRSQAVQNAKGVCLLRMGRYELGMVVFRDLVFPAGAFTIPDETPTVVRVSYVTSLVLSDRLVTGLQLLGQIPDSQHPVVVRLKDAVRRWKRTLSLWQRIGLLLGVCPSSPMCLDFAPGALFIPWEIGGPRPMERAA